MQTVDLDHSVASDQGLHCLKSQRFLDTAAGGKILAAAVGTCSSLKIDLFKF